MNQKKTSKKKILIIGGTYFLGRIFTLYSFNQYELTLINRGKFSMKNYPVKEIHFDRHNSKEWEKIHGKFDAIIDFCAYSKEDISTLIDHLDASFKQYILISSIDVYKHEIDTIIDETSQEEDVILHGQFGEYVAGKLSAEHELASLAKLKEFNYTILRLADLYGPFNYAPRESELIKRVISGDPLYHLIDANGKFQLLYVKDAAIAIQKIIDHSPKEKLYNIVPNVSYCYDDLNGVFKLMEKVRIEDHTIDEAISELYPVPYTLYRQDTKLADGSLFINEFDFEYTPLEDGLIRTYKGIKNIIESTKQQRNSN